MNLNFLKQRKKKWKLIFNEIFHSLFSASDEIPDGLNWEKMKIIPLKDKNHKLLFFLYNISTDQDQSIEDILDHMDTKDWGDLLYQWKEYGPDSWMENDIEIADRSNLPSYVKWPKEANHYDSLEWNFTHSDTKAFYKNNMYPFIEPPLPPLPPHCYWKHGIGICPPFLESRQS